VSFAFVACTQCVSGGPLIHARIDVDSHWHLSPSNSKSSAGISNGYSDTVTGCALASSCYALHRLIWRPPSLSTTSPQARASAFTAFPPCSVHMNLPELVSLQATLNEALDAIQIELETSRLPELSSFATTRHPLDESSFTTSHKLYEARRLALGMPSHFSCSIRNLVALAVFSCARKHLALILGPYLQKTSLFVQARLKHILQPPFEKVVEQTCAVYDTACLDIAVRAGVVDCLASSPDTLANGLHVSVLQRELDVDQVKLSVVLRYLATEGWVHQKADGVFSLARPALELLPGRNGRKWVM